MLIEHERLGYPLDATFRNMLNADFQSAGRPAGSRVYGRETAPGTHIYYFSPGTYRALKANPFFIRAREKTAKRDALQNVASVVIPSSSGHAKKHQGAIAMRATQGRNPFFIRAREKTQ